MESGGDNPIRYHHAGIDGIDANLARPKLLCQRPRDGVHRALGSVVNHRSWRSQRAGKRANVNDAAAVRVEMFQRFLSREKHSKNICIEMSVEMLLAYFLQRQEFVDTGVIDEDIDLAESLFRGGEKFFDVGLFRNAALNGESFSAAFCDFIDN